MLRKQGRGRRQREEADKAVDWDDDVNEANKTKQSIKKPKFLEIQSGAADPLRHGKKQLGEKLKK